MSGFKLSFESKFDILYAIFCFNFSLYWCCLLYNQGSPRRFEDLGRKAIFFFMAGPHNAHGPYFYCAEKPRSDDEISVVC